jgi:hypothetical protein
MFTQMSTKEENRSRIGQDKTNKKTEQKQKTNKETSKTISTGYLMQRMAPIAVHPTPISPSGSTFTVNGSLFFSHTRKFQRQFLFHYYHFLCE